MTLTPWFIKYCALALVLLLPHALTLCDALADTPAPARYQNVRASDAGIGKVYMGREIAQVMSFHGAAWLERPERLSEERPDLVLAALDLKPGMTVADIGAGSGYYARRMAERLGAGGMVYAVDVQPEMVKILEGQLARMGRAGDSAGSRAATVKPVLGTTTDPRLPPGSLDLALMVDVYHEFEFPHEMLVAIMRALKPGGRLVFVEYRALDAKVPIKALHTMTEAQVKKEAAVHPLVWLRTASGLPWQHVIVFRKQ
ncbi:MAG: methyltransferase domain-containing protein [Betaproteobacteria bacterium]|nr:methyltransferase domain-containing protein [Betaproteobacteria bacterium]